MKILLVSNYLPDQQASMLRYATMLERGLRARGHDASTISPPERLLRLFRRAPAPVAKWIAYVDKFLLAPWWLAARARHADLVHVCDHSNSMYLRHTGGRPSVITCHDLLAVFAARGRFPEERIGFTGKMLQRWIASGLLRAPYVVCVSRKTKDDLQELAAGHAPPSTVLHNPLNWHFHPVPADETRRVFSARGLDEAPEYLVHVGGNSWYKNRPAVVRIFAALKRSSAFAQTRLILAGKPWNRELRTLVAASEVSSDILEWTEVSNEEVRALYSGARALLFPSREEGFGWPILEAQACGCPVITTDRAPMTEVAGGAAILIDPDRADEAAATILSQLGRLPALRAQGLQNASLFSLDRALDGYIAAYEHALASQRLQAR
ncbi:MAG TPA: glycosyltransferase family 1 protein [Acidobacteriaceae bacterium]